MKGLAPTIIHPNRPSRWGRWRAGPISPPGASRFGSASYGRPRRSMRVYGPLKYASRNTNNAPNRGKTPLRQPRTSFTGHGQKVIAGSVILGERSGQDSAGVDEGLFCCQEGVQQIPHCQAVTLNPRRPTNAQIIFPIDVPLQGPIRVGPESNIVQFPSSCLAHCPFACAKRGKSE